MLLPVVGQTWLGLSIVIALIRFEEHESKLSLAAPTNQVVYDTKHATCKTYKTPRVTDVNHGDAVMKYKNCSFLRR